MYVLTVYLNDVITPVESYDGFKPQGRIQDFGKGGV